MVVPSPPAGPGPAGGPSRPPTCFRKFFLGLPFFWFTFIVAIAWYLFLGRLLGGSLPVPDTGSYLVSPAAYLTGGGWPSLARGPLYGFLVILLGKTGWCDSIAVVQGVAMAFACGMMAQLLWAETKNISLSLVGTLFMVFSAGQWIYIFWITPEAFFISGIVLAFCVLMVLISSWAAEQNYKKIIFYSVLYALAWIMATLFKQVGILLGLPLLLSAACSISYRPKRWKPIIVQTALICGLFALFYSGASTFVWSASGRAAWGLEDNRVQQMLVGAGAYIDLSGPAEKDLKAALKEHVLTIREKYPGNQDAYRYGPHSLWDAARKHLCASSAGKKECEDLVKAKLSAVLAEGIANNRTEYAKDILKKTGRYLRQPFFYGYNPLYQPRSYVLTPFVKEWLPTVARQSQGDECTEAGRAGSLNCLRKVSGGELARAWFRLWEDNYFRVREVLTNSAAGLILWLLSLIVLFKAEWKRRIFLISILAYVLVHFLVSAAFVGQFMRYQHEVSVLILIYWLLIVYEVGAWVKGGVTALRSGIAARK